MSSQPEVWGLTYLPYMLPPCVHLHTRTSVHAHTHTELSKLALSDSKHRRVTSDDFTLLLDLPGQAYYRQRELVKDTFLGQGYTS